VSLIKAGKLKEDKVRRGAVTEEESRNWRLVFLER
jgi:hypothetical protein